MKRNTVNLVCISLLLVFAVAACETTPTPVSDNATNTGALVIQLLEYVNLAEQEALAAWQLYEATKEATALQKVSYWLQYAAGVTQHIETLIQAPEA